MFPIATCNYKNLNKGEEIFNFVPVESISIKFSFYELQLHDELKCFMGKIKYCILYCDCIKKPVTSSIRPTFRVQYAKSQRLSGVAKTRLPYQVC